MSPCVVDKMEEKLIEAVRNQQVLYDTSHVDYMRTKLKNLKWEEIAQEVGMKTGTEAKALWEKLRHSLRDAIRRQQKYFKSGAPAQSIKEWKYQKQMGFLQPYMANKSREGNLRGDDDEENLTQDSQQNEIFTEVDNETVDEMTIQRQDKGVEDELQSQKRPATSPLMLATTPISNPTPRSDKKFIKKDNVTTLFKKSMEKREERAKARMEQTKSLLEQLKPTQNDPLFHFFMSMYESTKRMPPSYQHIVKKRVFNAVSEVEDGLLLDNPAVQQQSGLVEKQPYYQTIHPGPATTSSCSNSSIPAYSDNSVCCAVTREEENYSTGASSASSVPLINYINAFQEL